MKRKSILLFMPKVNQTSEKLMAKVSDIEDLQILLDRPGMDLRVLVADDGSNPGLKTLETLEKMKEELGGIFDFFSYAENVGKTVTVAEGLRRLLAEAELGDLMGCLDDNEHFFISALNLIEQIVKGYFGAIGTISYPDSILNQIDRHAMPVVGAMESQVMNLKGKLCI